MPTIEERLAAYRDVLDESVTETTDSALDIEPRRAASRRGLLAVAAAAVLTVAGIVAIGSRDRAVAPIASVAPTVPTASSVSVTSAVAPTTALTPATPPANTVTSNTGLSADASDATLAAALEPITFQGSKALSDAMQAARSALVGSCMRAAGFPYEPELVGVNTLWPREDEVEAVRAWMAASEENQALPGYRDALEGDDGCLGRALAAMYPDPDYFERSDARLERLRTEGYDDIRGRIFTDPEYLGDLGVLATCLADQGYEVDASLADPERTNEEIAEVWDVIGENAESVDLESAEFLPEIFAVTDAPMNAVCPTFSSVTRESFIAAEHRAGDAWLAERPELLEPIRAVMVDELRRFLQIIETADRLVGTVEIEGAVVEVTTRDGGTGLCGYFVGLGGGCDTIDPAAPAVFVTVPIDGDTRTVLYGFMPAGWTVWMEADGVRVDVAVSRDDGLGTVAIGAPVPDVADAERVELVQVDEAGSVRRTEVQR